MGVVYILSYLRLIHDDPIVGGVLDLIVGRVDSYQLVSVCNKLWHGDSYMTKLLIF